MPYILVNVVLDILSVALFCLSSAALLSQYPRTRSFLPKGTRHRWPLAFLVYLAVLLALAAIVDRVTARLASGWRLSQVLTQVSFWVGFANTVVLAYRSLTRRWFAAARSVPRRLLTALLSLLVTGTLVIAVVIAVVAVFTIR
jgi:hypothetical protein